MAKRKASIETYRSDTGGVVKMQKGAMNPSKRKQKKKKKKRDSIKSMGGVHDRSGIKWFKGD